MIKRSDDHDPIGAIMFPQLFIFTNRAPTDSYPYRWAILSSKERLKDSINSTKQKMPKLFIIPFDYFISDNWDSDTEMKNYLSSEFDLIDHFGGYSLLKAQDRVKDYQLTK